MSTTVRIQATVEIEVGTWGDEGSTGDLARQSVREAKVALSNALRHAGNRQRIVSVDKVIFVTHSVEYKDE